MECKQRSGLIPSNRCMHSFRRRHTEQIKHSMFAISFASSHARNCAVAFRYLRPQSSHSSSVIHHSIPMDIPLCSHAKFRTTAAPGIIIVIAVAATVIDIHNIFLTLNNICMSEKLIDGRKHLKMDKAKIWIPFVCVCSFSPRRRGFVIKTYVNMARGECINLIYMLITFSTCCKRAGILDERCVCATDAYSRTKNSRGFWNRPLYLYLSSS